MPTCSTEAKDQFEEYIAEMTRRTRLGEADTQRDASVTLALLALADPHLEHKQWYIEQICRLDGFTMNFLDTSGPGVPPYD